MLFHHVLLSWQVHPASHKVSSEKWKEVWESKSAMYCGTSSRVRGKRTPAVQEERVATFNWMVDLNHALKSCGKRLRDFGEQDDILEAPLLKKPRTLWLCTDQEAVQIAGTNFLKHSGIWLVHIYDPCHRSNNDLILSLSHAGLLRQTMWAMASYNILSGPWGRGNHWAMIQEMAPTYVNQTMSCCSNSTQASWQMKDATQRRIHVRTGRNTLLSSRPLKQLGKV